ncbi:virulence factor SrfB, partial [Rosenbergiella collisarenosi]
LINRLQPKFFPVSSHEIDIRFPWDEACCGQIFWLWQQLRTQSVEALQQYYQRSPHTAHLRIALIDVGGGTTDVAVTEYPLISPENSAAPAFSPQLLRREGFTLAGDSLLEDIITHFLLPQLGDHLRQQGLSSVGTILERLFSREKSCEGDTVWR